MQILLRRWPQLIFAALLIMLSGCSKPPAAADWQTQGKTMGSHFLVKVAQCQNVQCNSSLSEQIADRLHELDSQYSTYVTDSEVSRFNLKTNSEWFPASRELVELVELSNEISQRSNGAFDITVGQAVNVWGFGPSDPQLPPPEEAIAAARQHSGYKNLSTRKSPAALRKADPALSIDLSAIAKGYAVDQIAYMLEFADIKNYIIDIGGELRLAGFRSDGKPWRVGIEPPNSALKIDFVISPGDNAVATSGDYRNFYVLDDRTISHTIDPTTALPVSHTLSSVTVITPLAAHADAWATALMVMGPKAGFEYAEQAEMPALFLSRTPDGFEDHATSAMQRYLSPP